VNLICLKKKSFQIKTNLLCILEKELIFVRLQNSVAGIERSKKSLINYRPTDIEVLAVILMLSFVVIINQSNGLFANQCKGH